jgi:hypothetical protein
VQQELSVSAAKKSGLEKALKAKDFENSDLKSHNAQLKATSIAALPWRAARPGDVTPDNEPSARRAPDPVGKVH